MYALKEDETIKCDEMKLKQKEREEKEKAQRDVEAMRKANALVDRKWERDKVKYEANRDEFKNVRLEQKKMLRE